MYNTDEDDTKVKSKVLISLNNIHGMIDYGKNIIEETSGATVFSKWIK